MKSLALTVCVVLLVPLAAGCGGSVGLVGVVEDGGSPEAGTPVDAGSGPGSDGSVPDDGGQVSGKCAAAGGTCVLGGASCAVKAPNTAQDCNPGHNPGGAFCCLEFADGGKATDGGGTGDSGVVTCQSAGGQCVAVVPGACAGGTVASQYSCGTGVGVECCISPPSDGGGAFACGPTLTCDGTTQICAVSEGGPKPPPDAAPFISYACQPIPSACVNDVSCTCIKTAASAQICSASGGDVTVTYLLP